MLHKDFIVCNWFFDFEEPFQRAISNHFDLGQKLRSPGSDSDIMSMNYAPSMFWGTQSFDSHQLALGKLGGDDESRRRARKYIDLVRAQRVGPVHVDESSNDGDWVQLWVADWSNFEVDPSSNQKEYSRS